MSIFIQLKNGMRNVWNSDEFTDYGYDGKYFKIFKGKYLVGLYNLDEIVNVIVNLSDNAPSESEVN